MNYTRAELLVLKMFLVKALYFIISFFHIFYLEKEQCCIEMVYTTNKTSQVFVLNRNSSLSEPLCTDACIYSKLDDRNGGDEYCFQLRSPPNISPSQCTTNIEPSLIFIELFRTETMTQSTTYKASKRYIRTKKRFLTRTRQSPRSNMQSN